MVWESIYPGQLETAINFNYVPLCVVIKKFQPNLKDGFPNVDGLIGTFPLAL